jgi:hypothetical protein
MPVSSLALKSAIGFLARCACGLRFLAGRFLARHLVGQFLDVPWLKGMLEALLEALREFGDGGNRINNKSVADFASHFDFVCR